MPEAKNNQSKFRGFLKSEVSTYWGFALAVILVITSVSVPFFGLRSRVSLLEQEVRYTNTIATNHLQKIEKDVKELKTALKENRKKLEEVSLEIAEIKALLTK